MPGRSPREGAFLEREPTMMFYNSMEWVDITTLSTIIQNQLGGERTEEWSSLHLPTITFQALVFTKLLETLLKEIRLCLNSTQFKHELLDQKIKDPIGLRDSIHLAQELTYRQVISDTSLYHLEKDWIRLVPYTVCRYQIKNHREQAILTQFF